MPPHPRPPSHHHLLTQACASIDHGSAILAEAAASLSSALLDLRADTPVKPRKKARQAPQPKVSPHFDLAIEQKKPSKSAIKKVVSQVGPQVSPYFAIHLCRASPALHMGNGLDTSTPDPFSCYPTPPGLAFSLQPARFGLIQERICRDLYALVVQAILWNKTRGAVARPVLWALLSKFQTPAALAKADLAQVEDIIRPLGLQQRRAQRLVDMAIIWVTMPPALERRFGRRHYPSKGWHLGVKDGELLGPEDAREGWEIAHLPGVGEYALDSFRIFGRDRLRGLAEDTTSEPEWKRIVPRDKELGPYVKWRWACEGWAFDIVTGRKKKLT